MKTAEDILYETLSYYNCETILSERVTNAVINAIKEAQTEAWNEAIWEAAESAEVEDVGTYNAGGEADDCYIVNKQSILNLLK